MKSYFATLALAGVVFATPAPAQQQDHAGHHATAQKSPATTEGEVRKIDKDAKKLTLRHGPIANLDMPAMTMVFQIQDASVLDALKVGDKVRFNAEKIGGSYTVTQLEPAK